ncbi:alcohol dehydrogenase catalytic domain-containing protein [bacterium]|nr:alcohol dehydrogenase catalytic domain-containing protein [bacterium]
MPCAQKLAKLTVTMRAAVYYKNDDIRIEDVPVPEIGHGEMLLKVMTTGICGSDVHEFYRAKHAPVILGHELAGIIEETGEGVEDFKPGDRITCFHHVPCGACPRCVNGHETACDTFKKVHFYPGGFSEYVRIHPLQVRLGAMKLPEDMSFEVGAFAEPVGCVYRGQRLAGMAAGKKILIIGSGIAGVIHIKLAKLWGASLVVATDIHQFRKMKGLEFGADSVFDASADVPRLFRDMNDGWGADIVILNAMAPSAIRQAMDTVEKGGTILIFGLGAPGQTMDIPLGEFLAGEISVITSYSGGPVDSHRGFELIKSGRIDVGKMITHRFPLEKIQEGFQLTAAAGESLKVMLFPHEMPETDE